MSADGWTPEIIVHSQLIHKTTTGQALLFFILCNQMPTSLNFFAINKVQPSLPGIPLTPVSGQALNPMWIIVLSPVLAYIYTRLGERGRSPHDRLNLLWDTGVRRSLCRRRKHISLLAIGAQICTILWLIRVAARR